MEVDCRVTAGLHGETPCATGRACWLLGSLSGGRCHQPGWQQGCPLIICVLTCCYQPSTCHERSAPGVCPHDATRLGACHGPDSPTYHTTSWPPAACCLAWLVASPHTQPDGTANKSLYQRFRKVYDLYAVEAAATRPAFSVGANEVDLRLDDGSGGVNP